ncbi:MAG TPA: hypothetical protein VLX28_04390 [Thermoanaerobaculia bacterium]|nr:hypothetical protein [Thermoanaerobaculia bacterium]
MARSKTKAELEAEIRFLRKQSRHEALTTMVTQLFKWGGLSFIAWATYLSIAVLAGRSTKASILVSVLGDLRFTQAVSWALAVGGTSYGVAQARLRKKTERRLGDRVKELEQELDPGRSSSS